MLSLVILGVLVSVVHAESYTTYPNIKTCVGLPVQYSCENTSVVTDSCCNVVRGGLVLQAQYWYTYTGLEHQAQLFPKNSWSIHGIVPLNCDGTSIGQYCDPGRQYDPKPLPSTLPNGTVINPYKGPSVRKFIQEFGRSDLLDYMDTFWINQGAPNEDLWAHEYSIHATCTSAFDVACYEPGYKKYQEVVNFFETAVKVYQMYPTYDILAASGIVPSNTTRYTRAQITNVIYSQIGADPWLGCDDNGTVWNQIRYFHHVLGTEQFGHFKPLDSIISSTCAETGIWYYERTPTSEKAVSA